MYVAFLSYSSEDNICLKGRVIEFCNLIDAQLRVKLGLKGQCVFVDQYSIKLGIDWKNEIEDEIGEVSVFLPVVSPNWLKSDICRDEYDWFIQREKLFTAMPGWLRNTRLIIPLVLQNPLKEQEASPIWIDIRSINQPESIVEVVRSPHAIQSQHAYDLAESIAERICELHLLIKQLNGDQVESLTSNRDNILDIFRRYSVPLATWPRTIAGGWLKRPELTKLLQLVESHDSSTRFVVGKPGTGKSALLSQLCSQLSDIGTLCLGIKADALPIEIDSLEKLSQHVLGSEADLARTLRMLGLHQKVVVVIDQLDALASLVDLHTGRLNVLLDLIARIRGSRGIYLVASVREFDLRYDQRLKGLLADEVDCNGQRIDLPGFSREQVLTTLRDGFQIDAQSLRDEHLRFLETPYHLAQFTRHYPALTEGKQLLPHEQFFENIQGAHQRIYEVTVAKSRNRDGLDTVLQKLVEKIENTESLWHDSAAYGLNESHQGLIDELEGMGWLLQKTEGEKFGFAHQTQYEFLLGKRFLESPTEFVEYVRNRQNSLFVRPTVWLTLALMRLERKPNYEQAMGQLLAQIERRHLRRLFVEFLAEVSGPSDAELRWVEGMLASPEHSAKMCWLIRGNRGWFEKLPDAVFDSLMKQPPDAAWPVARLIEGSWQLESDRTKCLLRRHWAYHRDYVDQIWFVLSQAEAFDEEMYAWLCYCAANKTNEGALYVDRTMAKLAKQQPVWAYQLFATILNRRLDQASSAAFIDLKEMDSDKVKAQQLQELTEQRRVIDEDLNERHWYESEEIAKLDPRSFVLTVWPWFVRAMQVSGDPFQSRLLTYRSEGDSYRWFRKEPWTGVPIVSAIEESMVAWAKKDRMSFLGFISTNGRVDSMTAHRLFARALRSIAHEVPEFVLTYFRDDARRLLIGECSEGSDSLSLLEAVIPFLPKQQIVELQQVVVGWQMYRDEGEPDLIDEYRAEVLSCIPAFWRTTEAKQLVTLWRKSIERRVEIRRSDEPTGFDPYEAPLQSKQMVEMGEAELLAALRSQLPTGEEGETRDGQRVRQSLAREFGEFAKIQPARAANIVPMLTQPSDGILAGAVVKALVELRYDDCVVLDLLRGVARVEYDRRDYQDNIGWALRQMATSKKGLPDDVLALLTHWLIDQEIQQVPSNKSEPDDSKRGSSEKATSILWSRRPLIGTLPNQWFHIGEAISFGYCLRETPNDLAAYQVFQQAIERPYPSRVWQAWLHFVIQYWPSRELIVKLIEQLLTKRPDVMASEVGISMVAKFGTWMAPGARQRYLDRLMESANARIQQGAGELAVILYVRDQDTRASECIRQELTAGNADQPSSFRLGIAFGAGNTWEWRKSRQSSLEIMKALLPTESADINSALLNVFRLRNELIDDATTRDMLQLIAEKIAFQRAREVYPLVSALEHFVRLNPQLTCRVMRNITDGLQKIKQSEALYHIGSIEDKFVNIVLTIHRQAKNDDAMRLDSLTLYEDLLELEVYGAFERLRELDNRPH